MLKPRYFQLHDFELNRINDLYCVEWGVKLYSKLTHSIESYRNRFLANCDFEPSLFFPNFRLFRRFSKMASRSTPLKKVPIHLQV